MKTPIETVKFFLANTTNPDVVKTVLDPSVTYISLSFSNPELQKILPWAGTHNEGVQSIIDAAIGINRFWTIQNFEIQDIFSEGGKVAAFGSFTYTSNTLGKQVTSPFSILAKVKDEKIFHFMFLEDTFATAGTFRVSPAGTFHSDPEGSEFKL